MRKAEVNITLPSFEELASAAAEPQAVNTAERSCAVIVPIAKARTLKVDAYCRVSTEHEEQQSSIRMQRQHFAALADKHEDWEFVGIYADIVFGTKKEKRPELLKLVHSRGGSFCFDDNTCKALIESITAYGKEDLIFHFRCGFDYRLEEA